MTTTLKRSLETYIDHFLTYDYIAFGWLILLFIVLFSLAIMVVRRRPFIALFIVFFDILLLLTGPFAIKWYLDSKFRSSETNITLLKKLNFTEVLIVEGLVKNTSKINFSTCTVHVNVLHKNKNNYLDKLSFLNPIVKKSILLESPPLVGDESSFRVLVSPFNYGGDYNVSTYSECY